MSKGKHRQFFDSNRTRRSRQERINKRELIDAQRGIIDNDVTSDETRLVHDEDYESLGWIPEDKRKWYIIDTNLILSCVDVLYDAEDKDWHPPLNFRPSLDNAHIIIPSTVFDELDHIKDGHTANRMIARKAFRRLRKLFPNSERTLAEISMLQKPIRTGWKQQVISILPLQKNFVASLPWVPSANDNDGWIAVTALAATMIRDGFQVDGSVPVEEIMQRSNARKDVVLLANDNPLLTKADFYGVRSAGYSFRERQKFTGMRELTVPAEMFERFWQENRLSKKDFEKWMPDEGPLIANEFIAMTPENDTYPKGYFAVGLPFPNVARFHKDSQTLTPLYYMKYERVFPPNAGIATYYEAMNDDSISVIVVTGKAGTGKTYQIVRHSIKALREGKYSQIVLIINANTGIGTLPGGPGRKIEPMIAFCKDAIRSYLASTPEFKKKREDLRKYGDSNSNSSGAEVKTRRGEKPNKHRRHVDKQIDERIERKRHRKQKAEKPEEKAQLNSKTYNELLNEQVNYYYDRYFMAIPYELAQGRSFEDSIIIVDEAQRIIVDEMETFITRLGKNSLLVVCGDTNQIKYNSPEKRIKNGLMFAQKMYFDWEGCANIYLTENMRHEATGIANRNYEKVIKELNELQT